MKITKSQLKQIIKEELGKVLENIPQPGRDGYPAKLSWEYNPDAEHWPREKKFECADKFVPWDWLILDEDFAEDIDFSYDVRYMSPSAKNDAYAAACQECGICLDDKDAWQEHVEEKARAMWKEKQKPTIQQRSAQISPPADPRRAAMAALGENKINKSQHLKRSK